MEYNLLFGTIQEHMSRLTNIFKTLKKANLKIQTDKTEYFRKEVAKVGHSFTHEGMKPYPAKIKFS